MEPLAGWTVAVTADRRAAEQVAMLERRGATVMHAPVIRTLPLGPEAGLRAATAGLVDDPPDMLVVTTGIGVRSWFASSWTWGLGEALAESLVDTQVLARGPKAAGAMIGEGLPVHWRAPDETMAGVLEHLLTLPLTGRRLAVQLAGRGDGGFADALRAAGATVVELFVYEWVIPEAGQAVTRLVRALVGREIDAITFTSAHAVENLLGLAGPYAEQVRDCLATGDVSVACVGPLTAVAAENAGATDVVVASPARLGAMVRALAERFADQSQQLDLAGFEVTVQGAQLQIGGKVVRLTRRERLLLESLIGSEGAMLSKRRLSEVAWDEEVIEHTVEAAVNRLRGKLGPAGAALENTNRRGYRLAVSNRSRSGRRPPMAI
jgi:uroporphyrinogen-III synthase